MGILERYRLRSKVSYLSHQYSGMKSIIVGKILVLFYILLMFFFSHKFDHIVALENMGLLLINMLFHLVSIYFI